jgi:TonB family protein
MFHLAILFLSATPDAPDKTTMVSCPDGTIIPVGQVCPPNELTYSPRPYGLKPPVGPNQSARPTGNPSSWVRSDDYPARALQKEIAGTTAFTLDVTKWGSVADCTITSSSGDAYLDDATCKNVALRARFYPATDAQSKPITGKYSNRVRWAIPMDDPVEATEDTPDLAANYNNDTYIDEAAYPEAPTLLNYEWNYPNQSDYPAKAKLEKRSGITYLDLSIDNTGAVSDCKVTTSSGHADLDLKSCEIAKARAEYTPALDIEGKPSNGRISTGVAWSLPNVADAKATSGQAVPYKTPPPQPYKRPQLFKEAGFAEVEYVMTANGKFGVCSESGELFKKNGERMNMCDEAAREDVSYEPYLDAAGKPVAKKVKARISVDISDVK